MRLTFLGLGIQYTKLGGIYNLEIRNISSNTKIVGQFKIRELDLCF